MIVAAVEAESLLVCKSGYGGWCSVLKLHRVREERILRQVLCRTYLSAKTLLVRFKPRNMMGRSNQKRLEDDDFWDDRASRKVWDGAPERTEENERPVRGNRQGEAWEECRHRNVVYNVIFNERSRS